MPAQFDATARISVDLSGFRAAAQQVSRSGGDMERTFTQLHSVLGSVEIVEKQLAAELSKTLGVYQKISAAAKSYAQAIQTLAANEGKSAQGAQLMAKAFNELDSALSKVSGISEKEYSRLTRTLSLYEQMARAIKTYAQAQQAMLAISQRAQQVDAKDAAAKEKASQSADRLAQSQQRLALAQQRANNAFAQSATSVTHFSSSTYALRSSLGEVETSAQQLMTVLLKIPNVLGGAAISQESAFAQVTRVVGEAQAQAAGLQGELVKIAQSAPISFEEVATIAQIGGQIGIAANQLGAFTDTITRFSLTTGVAADQSTLLLGRIAELQNVPISQVEQLASTILKLGTASAATDEEILRVNESIATVGNLFGLSATAVAGLSSALATVHVQPELARGSLTRVFGQLRDAATQGGSALTQLSAVMGMTAKQAQALYKSSPDDFLLAFVKGLSNINAAGGSVKNILAGLGVNAVRDVDAFSRLANNYDILATSVDTANDEFIKGTELQRQSQGIYDTTASRLQNLSDTFQGFLAAAGKPLATALGIIASGLETVIGAVTKLGPVVGIIGSIGAAAGVGVAAWAAYQVALSKFTQTAIAMRELQNNLGVSTLSLNTAMKAWNGTLDGNVVSLQAAAASAGRFQESAVVIERAMVSNAAASEAAAKGYRDLAGSAASLSGTIAANAAAVDEAAAANANFAVTSTQAGLASERMAGQMTLVGAEVDGMNAATAALNPALLGMSASMERAATAGAALGAGMRTTATGIQAAADSSVVASSAFTVAATEASAASKVMSLAFGPVGLAVLGITTLMVPFISSLVDFSSESDKLYESATKASGGIQALQNAIKADTEAAATGAKVYREVAVSASDLSEAQRKTAENTRKTAQAQIDGITLVAGSVTELKKQAQGHDEGAVAAQHYLSEIAKANQTVAASNKVLAKNTAAIGEQSKKWLLSTAETELANSTLTDGSDRSRRALEQLNATHLDIGATLTKSLSNPTGALDDLDAAIAAVSKTADNIPLMGNSKDVANIQNNAAAAGKLKDFLVALRKSVGDLSDSNAKGAVTQQLLGKALDSTGQSAGAVGGNVKLGADALKMLDENSDEAQQGIDDLAQTFSKFGSPLDAFKNAAQAAFGDAKDAMDKFSLSTKGGLDSYIKQLDKIATAQRNWSTNLIKVSATLGPAIAQQFQDLGPEAAPAVAQLADLGVKQLEQIKPKLEAIGNDSIAGLAASITKGGGELKNATASTAKIIADLFGKASKGAKSSADFDQVVDDYNAVLAQLSKSKTKIAIDIDDTKAFKSLDDIRTYINLVNTYQIKPQVAIDVVKAQGDISKLASVIAAAKKSGQLDVKGQAYLDSILFNAQVDAITGKVGALTKEHKLDAKGKGTLDTSDYNAKLNALLALIASKNGSGILSPKGKAQLDDKSYRSTIFALAQLVLSDEQLGKLSPHGLAKMDDKQFRALLDALAKAIAGMQDSGKLNPKGTAFLNTDNFNRQLRGLAQAAYQTGTQIQANLTRTATVSVRYHAVNSPPPATMAAASGGWIRGPGGPRDDKVHTMLSNNEFVVNAASAKRHASLLEAINSNRFTNRPVMAKSVGRSMATEVGRYVPSPRRSFDSFSDRTARNSLVRDIARSTPAQRSGPVITVNNQYPMAEPTSTTINRSLAYAASLSGTI